MSWIETILLILLVLAIVTTAFIYADSEEAHADSVYVANEAVEEPQEPQELTINVEYTYIPTAGYECLDALAPEHIVNLDEFEQMACMLAQTLYGECRGLTKYEQSLVCWTIFNRYDSGKYGDTFAEIITAPSQFMGYRPEHPIDKELYSLAVDCLLRWQAEDFSVGNIGRTLPKQYTSFYGDGKHNYFRTADKSDKFDFDGPDPYGDRPF